MIPNPTVLTAQLPFIQKIIDDETWLEGERRGRPVDPDDPVVVDHVCAVILRVGGELRASAIACLSCREDWAHAA